MLGCLLASPRCELAAELGVTARLDSHYTGVYLPEGREMSTTAAFARAFLQAALRPLCNGSSSCEPSVMLHDSYSPSIEMRVEGRRGAWEVLDATDPSVWAESYWPDGLYATMWPYAPRTSESVFMLALAAVNALVALAVIRLARCGESSGIGGWLRFK
uniref:Nicastrin n=1 Tax=Coccolithus braarudii TaxID=221442 RepID=A0A7S0LC46_9EUKA